MIDEIDEIEGVEGMYHKSHFNLSPLTFLLYHGTWNLEFGTYLAGSFDGK